MVLTVVEPLYTASVTVQGGREGRAASADGSLDLSLTAPVEMDGPGTGTNPEELFAAGYAACFQSALSLVAEREGIDASASRVTADVLLGRTDDEGYALAVTLTVSVPGLDDEQTRRLIAATHEVCPYSRATRGNIVVDLVAGQA